jgi:CarD family transcriptional regulator
MYEINDIVIYGKMGACKIMDISTPKNINTAKNQLYYTMKSLKDNCLIYTPVNTKVFMRPAMSAEEINRLIDLIPTIKAEAYYNDSAQELTKHYESAIAGNNFAELIKLTMSIHAKKDEIELKNKKIGQIDQKFMKQAEEILFGEISLALGIPLDEAQEYIASRVESKGLISA